MERLRLWIPEPDGAGSELSLKLLTPDRMVPLLTLNTARGRIHWRAWAKMTRAWRDQARLEAEASAVRLELEAGERVAIDVLPIQPGGILADPGAHMPTVKACVDGLRDAGWIPDDSGRYVSAITMLPPVKSSESRPAGLVMDLTAVPAIVPSLF